MVTTLRKIRLAADIGGTFTDAVIETPDGMFTAKVPTDVDRPERGVMAGVSLAMAQAGVAAQDVDVFIRGTTLATKAAMISLSYRLTSRCN